MFPHPVPAHDIFTLVVHSLLDGVGIGANLALMWCVVFRTPKTLRSFSIIILARAFADLVGCTTSLIVCVRLIPIYFTLGMIYIGPCAVFSSKACHFTFALMLSFFTFSLYLIAFAFGYRLYVIFRKPPQLLPLIFCTSLVYIPSFLMLLVYLPSADNDADVKNAIQRSRPHYKLDHYVVNGHLSVLSPRVAITLAGCTVPWVPLLIIIIFIRRMVKRKISELRRFTSVRSCEIHKTLIQCLTIQASLPITFIAGSLFFYLSLFNIIHSPLQEHFIMMTVAIMPTVSPMISIRFIKPYRDVFTFRLPSRISQRSIPSRTIASGRY